MTAIVMDTQRIVNVTDNGPTSQITVNSAGLQGPQGNPTTVNGHTGSTITLTAADVSAIATSARGAANGVASLDASSLVPIAQIPTTALAASFMDLSTNQTVATGIKTFSVSPVVPTPTTATQVANKGYVDGVAQGLNVKSPSATCATTAALPTNTYANGTLGVGATLTATAVGVLTVDGHAVVLNEIVLVQNEAAPANNGLYLCTTAGTGGVAYVLTRTTNMDQAAEIPGAFSFVETGTTNAGAGFTVAGAGSYVMGTTAIVWTQFSGAGEITAGTGLSKSGNTISLATPVSVANGGTGSATQNFVDLTTTQAAIAGLKTFTTGIAVPTTGSVNANGVTDWFNVKRYGAKGDGSTDDTTAIQAAITAAQVAGGTVYFPAGIYIVTPTGSPALSVTAGSSNAIKFVGAGKLTTTLRKSANGVLLSASGPSTDPTGATHTRFFGIDSLGFDGNSKTGSVLQLFYADNLMFRDIHIWGNADIAIDAVELWDSRFYNMTNDTCGSSTANASTPNVYIRNSKAASGFGFSTDSCNQLHFLGCRWENFRTGAVWIQQGTSGTGGPNGIYFTDSKMESSGINGGPHLLVDSNSSIVQVNHLYCFSGGFNGAYSTAQDVIQCSGQNCALENIFIGNKASPASVANGITISSPVAAQTAVLRNITANYNSAPTGAHINFSTNTGGYVIDNVTASSGTIFGGTLPSSLAANNPLTSTSGAPTDGSFAAVPLDGTIAVDKTNKRLYVRHSGGVWSRIPISTAGGSVTADTTVANTTTLTQLEGFSVANNEPQNGSVYFAEGYGTYSVTGTPTLTFAAYWGGTGGTLIASIPAITAASGITNAPFKFRATVTFRSTTSVTCQLEVDLVTNTTTGAVTRYIGTPTTATTVTTTSGNNMAVGFTWSAASASNTLTIKGGLTGKQN